MNHYHPGKAQFWGLFLVNLLVAAGVLGYLGR